MSKNVGQVICFVCGERITKMTGRDSNSLANHHVSYDPEITTPCHFGCHPKHHSKMRKLELGPMVSKLVTITGEQCEWLDKRCIALSKWVRKKIDEEMKAVTDER